MCTLPAVVAAAAAAAEVVHHQYVSLQPAALAGPVVAQLAQSSWAFELPLA